MACNITIPECGQEVSIDDILDFNIQDISFDATAPTLDEQNIDALLGKAKDLFDERYAKIKAVLEEQWEKQRITGAELASALMQASAQLSSGSLDDLIKLKQLENQIKTDNFKLKAEKLKADIESQKFRFQAKELKLNTILGLFKIDSQKNQAKLYKEQADGFRDQTKINSIKLLTTIWSTAYTQNQSTTLLDSIKKDQMDDTLKKWFTSIGLDDPTTP